MIRPIHKGGAVAPVMLKESRLLRIGAMKPSREPAQALTLIEVLMVTASVTILAAILLPVFARLKARSSHSVPLANDSNVSYFVGLDADPSRPGLFLSGDGNLAFNGVPVTPVPGTPGLHLLWTNSAVSWARPRHNGAGNICFSDGSVQQVATPQLLKLPLSTEPATNRLAVP
jgi:prepilin-type processing-associated H-X9-DG protein